MKNSDGKTFTVRSQSFCKKCRGKHKRSKRGIIQTKANSLSTGKGHKGHKPKTNKPRATKNT